MARLPMFMGLNIPEGLAAQIYRNLSQLPSAQQQIVINQIYQNYFSLFNLPLVQADFVKPIISGLFINIEMGAIST